jgi:hypothetical protein
VSAPDARRNDIAGDVMARNEEDAAMVIAILAALSAASAHPSENAAAGPASVWSDPAHRFGVRRPFAGSWWASGLPG